MRLTITDAIMRGAQTPHTAEPIHRDEPYGPWRVSWLPGRTLTRTQAVTAVQLAEAIAEMQEEGGSTVTDHTHRLWPHVDNWASELGLHGPDAVVRVSETTGR